jgi:hypothetical protein
MKILILAVALLSPLVATATEEIKTPYGTLKATEIPAQNASNFAITLDGKEVGKAAGKFLAYINNKYNFSVDYPASFSGHGEPDAGDGQVFTSPANDARLTTSANYCGEGLYSPARFLADHQQNSALKVTYSRQTKTLAVVSGTRGNRIFYDKLIFNGVQCAKFSLEYESTQREQYDALVARIAASLKQWSD